MKNPVHAFLNFFTEKFSMVVGGSLWDENLKHEELWLNLFHPNQRHFPKGLVNLENVSISESGNRVECGKTVFVAESSEPQSEFAFLSRNYFWIKFYKGRDTLEPYPVGGLFTKPYNSKVPFYYQVLFEAGIVGRLRVEKETKRNFGRKPATKSSSDNKMTCIVTLFMLCAIVAGLGGLVFIYECHIIPLNGICKILKSCATVIQFFKVNNTVTPY